MEPKLSDSILSGLRVMVVDDDQTYLHHLREKLQQYYEVKTFHEPTHALSFLRQSGEEFDLILADVHMPSLDGLQFLHIVIKRFNIPVILMSTQSEKQFLIRGLNLGASFYFVKPISEKEIKNIWQYVVKCGRHQIRESEQERRSVVERTYDERMKDDEEIDFDFLMNEENFKECFNEMDKRDDEQEKEDNNTEKQKKSRIIWTSELHAQFERVVHQLGIERAVPKKILEMMGRPDLSRENIASHLQHYIVTVTTSRRKFMKKYRLVLRKREQNKLSVDIARALNYWPFNRALGTGHNQLMLSNSERSYAFREQSSTMELQHRLFGNSQPFKAPSADHSLNPILLDFQQAQSYNSFTRLKHSKHQLDNPSTFSHVQVNNSPVHPNQCYMNHMNNIAIEKYGTLLQGNSTSSSSSTNVSNNSNFLGGSSITNSRAINDIYNARNEGLLNTPKAPMNDDVSFWQSLHSRNNNSFNMMCPQDKSNPSMSSHWRSFDMLDFEGKSHFPRKQNIETFGMQNSQENKSFSNKNFGSFSITSVEQGKKISSKWDLESFGLIGSQTNKSTNTENMHLHGMLSSQGKNEFSTTIDKGKSFDMQNSQNDTSFPIDKQEIWKMPSLKENKASSNKGTLQYFGEIDQQHQTTIYSNDSDGMQFKDTEWQIGLSCMSTSSMLVVSTDEAHKHPSKECNSLTESNQGKVDPSTREMSIPLSRFDVMSDTLVNISQDDLVSLEDTIQQQNDLYKKDNLDMGNESLSDIMQYIGFDVDMNFEDVTFNQDVNEHNTMGTTYDVIANSMVDSNNDTSMIDGEVTRNQVDNNYHEET